MNLVVYLIVVDIIPIGLLLLGGIYESRYSEFPNVKIGYKNKYSIENKETWKYSNKLASKMYGAVGSFLLVVNTLSAFMLGEEALSAVLMLTLILVVMMRPIIERIVKKKFNK
jgi:SdpI/YfhL protein family